MQIKAKKLTLSEILKLLEKNYLLNPNDTLLEIIDLEPKVVADFARSLPEWVTSIQMAPDISLDMQQEFKTNLSSSQRHLLAQKRYLPTSTIDSMQESDAPAKRKFDKIMQELPVVSRVNLSDEQSLPATIKRKITQQEKPLQEELFVNLRPENDPMKDIDHGEPPIDSMADIQIAGSQNNSMKGIDLPTVMQCYISCSTDLELLKSFLPFGQRQRREVYQRILQLKGDKNYSKQRHILGLFIENPLNFLEMTGIKTSLIEYQHRLDIPAENRILVAACLAIVSFEERHEKEFEVHLKEMFVFAAFDRPLFYILSCYIHLIKGEHERCIEIFNTCYFIREDFYSGHYPYLNFSERFNAFVSFDGGNLQSVLEEDAISFLHAVEELNETKNFPGLTALIDRCTFRPQSESEKSRPRKLPQLKFKILRSSPELLNLYVLVGMEYLKYCEITSWESTRRLYLDLEASCNYLDELLPWVTKKTADRFAEVCFELNCFTRPVQHARFMECQELVRVASLFSEENKQKLAQMLKNSVKQLLSDQDFILDHDDCGYAKNPYGCVIHIDNKTCISLQARMTVYHQLLKILNPSILSALINDQVTIFTDLSKTKKMNYSQKSRIYYILELTRLLDNLSEDLFSTLWEFYNNPIVDPQMKFSIADLVVNYLVKRNPCDYIDIRNTIKADCFEVIFANCRAGLHVLRDNIAYPAENILEMLCEKDGVESTPEQRVSLFKWMLRVSSSENVAVLILTVMRCCFDTEATFRTFLEDQVNKDMESIDSLISDLHNEDTGRALVVARAIFVMAPYLNMSLVDRLFEDLIQRVGLNKKEQKNLEATIVTHVSDEESSDTENGWNDLKYVIYPGLANMYIYLSPQRREQFRKSLSPEKQREIFYNDNFTRIYDDSTAQFLSENLHILPQMDDSFDLMLLVLYDEEQKTDVNILTAINKILVALYSPTQYVDYDYYISQYDTSITTNRNMLGSLLRQLLDVATELEKELLPKQQSSHYKKELLKELFYAVARHGEPLDLGHSRNAVTHLKAMQETDFLHRSKPMVAEDSLKHLQAMPAGDNKLFCWFIFACLTNNPLCLQHVFRKLQDKDLKDDIILDFNSKLSGQLEKVTDKPSYKLGGYVLSEKINLVLFNAMPAFELLVQKSNQVKIVEVNDWADRLLTIGL